MITAGPTWVAIDKVRVISNIATGQTGILLSRMLSLRAAKVTLLLGSGEISFPDKGFRVIRYRFFDELNRLLRDELKTGAYDAVIHSAAVSDYRPEKIYQKKISSGIKNWGIQLVPTPKLSDNFVFGGKDLLKVGFKFEPGISDERLICEGLALRKASNLDLVVANGTGKNGYRAFIVGERVTGPFLSKAIISKRLCGLLNKIL